ncbi:MAG: EamA family transporter [Myxococcales bacterium]|nr:EamA family transporter [Myxococcales bacterium]
MAPGAGEAMAIACAACWATSVVLFRRVGTIDPRALNVLKNLVAIVLLLITLALMGQGLDRGRSDADWARLVGSALLGIALGDTLFLAGLQRIGGSVAAVVDCAYSPTVVLLSVLVLGEPLRGSLLAGGALVVCGLGVVSWPERATTLPPSARVDFGGVLLALAGVVATAIGVVMAKPALERSDLVEATTVRLVVALACLLVWQAATGSLRDSLAILKPQPMWRIAVPAAVLSTYVSMLLWLGAFKWTLASRAALLNQMATVFLLVLARTVGGEVVPLRRWVGAGIAVAGVVVVVLW